MKYYKMKRALVYFTIIGLIGPAIMTSAINKGSVILQSNDSLSVENQNGSITDRVKFDGGKSGKDNSEKGKIDKKNEDEKEKLIGEIKKLKEDSIKAQGELDSLSTIRNLKNDSISEIEKTIKLVVDSIKMTSLSVSQKNNLNSRKDSLNKEKKSLNKELNEFKKKQFNPSDGRLKKIIGEINSKTNKYKKKNFGPLPIESEIKKEENNVVSNPFTEEYNKAVARLDSVKAACRGSIKNIGVLSKTIGRFVDEFANLPKDDIYFEEAVFPAFTYVNISDDIKGKYKATYKKDIPDYKPFSSIDSVNRLLDYTPHGLENIDLQAIKRINWIADTLETLDRESLLIAQNDLGYGITVLIGNAILINQYDSHFFRDIVVPSFSKIPPERQEQILGYFKLIESYSNDCKIIGSYVYKDILRNKDWKIGSKLKGDEKTKAHYKVINGLESQDFYKRYDSLGANMEYTILGKYLLNLIGALKSKARSDSPLDIEPYFKEIDNLYLGSLSPEDHAKLMKKRQEIIEEAKQKKADSKKGNNTAPSDTTQSELNGNSKQNVETNSASESTSSEPPVSTPEPEPTTVTPTISAPVSKPEQINQNTVPDSNTELDANGDVKSGSKVPAPRKNK